MVKHVDWHSYANARVVAMGTQPKPSLGIQLK